MTTQPEFIEDIDPEDLQDFWDSPEWAPAQELLATKDDDDPRGVKAEPEQGAKVDPTQPDPIPEPIAFAVNALFDHYSYEQIREAVDRLHAARPHLGTAFSVWVTPDGSTLVNTAVPGVTVDREASTDDIRRAARDVEEFHQHQRIAAMVRSAL